MKLPILIALALILAFILGGIRHFVKTHGLIRVFYRFAFGHPLDGRHRTNAGYFRRGTTVTSGKGYASSWAHVPHAYRAAVRWGTIATCSALIFGGIKARDLTFGIVAGLLLIAYVANFKRVGRKVRGRVVSKTTANPLAVALAPMLALTPNRVSDSLVVNPQFKAAKSGEMVAVLVLPPSFAANDMQQTEVSALMHRRFGIDVDCHWNTSHLPMTLNVTRSPIPPTLVKFSAVAGIIRALPSGHVGLGYNGRGELKVWDLNSAEPHLMCVATSRRGKTRLLILILCQLARQGAELMVVLDPKQVGVDEALAGVPNAEIYNNPRNVQEMVSAVARFRKFMEMRMDKFAADRTIVFPQAILCIDEFSFWCGQVQDAWNEIRTRKDPARPPVFKDINAILFMGAQMNCRLMIFGQVVNYQLLGPAIESFGTKLMSGWNKQSYMRLIGITPVPVGSKARGRFLYYDSEDMHSIQVILGDDIELRKFALEGTPQATPDVIRVDSEMLVIDSPAKDVGADA